MTALITAIYGMEPVRDQESPVAYMVGFDAYLVIGAGTPARKFTVSKIERREENFGDHGLLWFDVFDGDRVALSMQGRAVAEVHYGAEAEMENDTCKRCGLERRQNCNCDTGYEPAVIGDTA